MYPKQTVGVLLEFKPRAVVRNHLVGIAHYAVFVPFALVINARASDKLADDNAFRAVDDKTSAVRHQRNVAHKDFFRLFDNARFEVGETSLYFKRHGIRRVAVFAFPDRILRLAVESVIDEGQFHTSRKVADGRIFVQHVFDAVFEETLVRILLNFDEVRNIEHVFDFDERVTLGNAILYLVNFYF